ncbi:amino acid permease [Pseudomonas plecoglossicida]|uniref:Amino acid permease n=1 Tax=Pseudomonas plecoglossicida TaxID=70775 RepID=A0ABX4U6J2_PSEDL|nr:amino acid permease [Pseudomonas plecoglossicida]PLU92937.1 amino acid permease [Pseudomonas plecoglossicida]PLV02523.1 amino acid permease [Pseudomonas plecoglossicida]PLV16762.1 amino acid permease [Pseudomonas plecoglossicida]
MRRLSVLLAVLTLAIFLSVLLAPRPPLVNRGTAQRMGHPVTGIGDIFRGY